MHGRALAESGWGAENKTQRRWEHDTCLPHFTINLSAKITPRLFLHTALQHKHSHARAHIVVVGRGSKVEGEGERGEGGRDRTRLLADHSSPHTPSVCCNEEPPGKLIYEGKWLSLLFLKCFLPLLNVHTVTPRIHRFCISRTEKYRAREQAELCWTRARHPAIVWKKKRIKRPKLFPEVKVQQSIVLEMLQAV